jgi:hypothetical protein
MIISLIGSSLCLSSLLWVGLSFLFFNKRENIEFDIERGLICPSCKENIYTEEQPFSKWPNHVQFCKKCQRDSILDNILNRKEVRIFNFIYSKNWKYYFIGFSFFSITLNVGNLFLHNGYCALFAGIILFSAQLFNYLNFLHTTRKKTQSK